MSAGSASGPDVGEKEFKVRIAVIVPCYKEEAAAGAIVRTETRCEDCCIGHRSGMQLPGI